MLSKFSIKRPLTIAVIILIILVIGFVAVFTLPIDLLPSMNIPMMVVATIVPGGAPELVEAEVSIPLEAKLRTLNNLKTISSTSAENMSLIMLEFKSKADMNEITTQINSIISTTKGSFPAMTVDPMVLKIDPTLLPVMSVAISKAGMSTEESSRYLENIATRLKSVDGVASVNASGLVSNSAIIKIKEGNNLLSPKDPAVIDMAMPIALKILSTPQDELPDRMKAITGGLLPGSILSQSALATAEGDSETDQLLALLLGDGGVLNEMMGSLLSSELISALLMAQNFEMPAGITSVGGVDYFIKIGDNIKSISDLKNTPLLGVNFKRSFIELEKNYSDAASVVITPELKEIIRAQLAAQFPPELVNIYLDGVIEALNNGVSLKDNLTPSEFIALQALVLSRGMSYAPHAASLFLMYEPIYAADDLDKTQPIGFEKDKKMVDWVKKYDPSLNVDIEAVSFVYDMNNASVLHTLINGAQGVMLTFDKQPNVSTVTVTREVNKFLKEMQEEDSNFSYITLSDQGSEIMDMISTIAINLILGAVLAIIILFIFLADWRPTIIVGLSIIFSVITAFALMYLAGVALNLVSMGGLVIAVGMLVDNSIVVIENIYRKRLEGMSGIKAAYEGAKQVSSAIFASTLTTVIVFLPIMFIEGMTKEIFTDLALTITFALAASLFIALTLVPMMASRVLKNKVKGESKWFVKFKGGYAKSLEIVLNKKWVTVLMVTVLFGASILGAVFMQKEFFPAVESDYINVVIKIDEKNIDGRSYDEAAQDVIAYVNEKLKQNKEVASIGLEVSSGMSFGGLSIGGKQINAYVLLNKNRKGKIVDIEKEIVKSISTVPGFEKSALSVTSTNGGNSMMGSMGAMVSADSASVKITGENIGNIKLTSDRLAEKFLKIDGVSKVDNGLGASSLEYKLKVDKNKASTYFLQTGQVLLAMNKLLTAPGSSTTIRVEETLTQYEVFVYDHNYKVNRWYRATRLDGTMQRIYIESPDYANAGENEAVKSEYFYVRLPDGTKEEITKANNEFRNTVTGEIYKALNNDLKIYYEYKPSIDLDLVAHELQFDALVMNGQEMTQSQKVAIFRLLADECFEKDSKGKILYRNTKDGFKPNEARGELVGADGVITDRDGYPIPKAIVMQEGLQSIGRIDGKRSINLTVYMDSNANQNAVKSEMQKILSEISEISGLENINDTVVEFVGENIYIQDTFKTLFMVLALAIVLIYLVMVGQFQSLKSPFIVMFTIPLAFTGSILTLIACNMRLSVFAAIGLIVLMGVVVNNGIVYIDYVNKLRLKGMSTREALIQTGKDRLRPILMTALTTIIAMITTVFDTSASGQSMKPMALTVVGGLTYSTILTLYFVPIMYEVFNKKDKMKNVVFDDDKVYDIEAEIKMSKINELKELQTVVSTDLGVMVNDSDIDPQEALNYQDSDDLGSLKVMQEFLRPKAKKIKRKDLAPNGNAQEFIQETVVSNIEIEKLSTDNSKIEEALLPNKKIVKEKLTAVNLDDESQVQKPKQQRTQKTKKTDKTE